MSNVVPPTGEAATGIAPSCAEHALFSRLG